MTEGGNPVVQRSGNTTPLGSITATTVDGKDAIVYAPLSGRSGTDTFKYTVKDNSGNTATATVTVVVSASGKGFVTVSSAEWSKSKLLWTISGTVGANAESPSTDPANVTSLLGTSTIGTVNNVPATTAGVAWKFGPAAGSTKSKSCGDKITVKSSLGPTVTGVPIKCKT